MAIKKVRIKPPGYTDIVHPETSADVVKFSDGSTVEEHKAQTATNAHLAKNIGLMSLSFEADNVEDGMNELKDEVDSKESPSGAQAKANAALNAAKQYTDEEVGKIADDLDAHKADIIQQLSKKVDKVAGKGLSTNDYTDEEKQKNQDNADNISDLQQELETHKADYIHLPYSIADGTNNYTTLINGISSLVEGMSVKIKFTNANTGASTLNINGLGAIPIKKSNGNDLSAGNIKAGQILHLVYTGSVFQSLGEGGEYGNVTPEDVIKGVTFGTEEGLKTGTLELTGNALASQVLKDRTFYNTDPNNKLVGTMENNGNVSSTITITGSGKPTKAIPSGYTSGGTITAQLSSTLASSIKKGATIGGVTGTFDGHAPSVNRFDPDRRYDDAIGTLRTGTTYFSMYFNRDGKTINRNNIIAAYVQMVRISAMYGRDSRDAMGTVEWHPSVPSKGIFIGTTNRAYFIQCTIDSIDPTYSSSKIHVRFRLEHAHHTNTWEGVYIAGSDTWGTELVIIHK